MLTQTGFQDVTCTNIPLTWILPNPPNLMDSFRRATARTSGMLQAQDPAQLPAIDAVMAAACAPYIKGDRTELPMPAVLTGAVKPSAT